MEQFYVANKPSLPQQVDINTENIEVLKKITETPAVIYNASVEISNDAGTVSASNVIQTVETTENAFILDTVGKLFRIINIVDTTIYIMYVSNIRGTTGATGETGIGIASVSSGDAIETETQTITPVTFVKTNTESNTVNVYANKTPVDDELSTTSVHPVQNKVVTNQFNNFIIRPQPIHITVGATGSSTNAITPVVPNGYSFLCWLQPESSGWIGSCYISEYNGTYYVYNAYGTGGDVKVWYLCQKNI